jgi:hypothetical protein
MDAHRKNRDEKRYPETDETNVGSPALDFIRAVVTED